MKWTNENVGRLASLRSKHSAAEVAEILGVSVRTVYDVSYRYGLAQNMRHKVPNLEISMWMKKNYPYVGNDVCAVCLGVSIPTVRAYAIRLGLRKSEEYLKERRAKGSKKDTIN